MSAHRIITDLNRAAANRGSTLLIDSSEEGLFGFHKAKIPINQSVAVTNGSNAGFYSLELCRLPSDIILPFGAYGALTFTAGTGGIADTANGDIHIGTAAQTDLAVANITDAQDNWAGTQAVAAFSGGAGAATINDLTSDGFLDATSATSVYLNGLIDGANISSDDTLAISGDLYLVYARLSDY